jgi:Protein of unknown function (DUF2778)
VITFQISTGTLFSNGATLGTAYSGAPGYVDDAGQTSVVAHGPIPVGTWGIGAPTDLPVLGPFCMALSPNAETNTFGRSAFFIHGDNQAHDETASEGCIVAARWLREAIWADPDHLLNVVA